MGYKLVIHPLASVLFEARALTELYTYYKEHGTTLGLAEQGLFMPRPEYQDLVGYSQEMGIRSLLD